MLFENNLPDAAELTDHHPDSSESTAKTEKRNSALNATRHGMCAKTLIMMNESEEDWLDLLRTWLAAYQNPAETSLLYNFVMKTAQAEWMRLRAQREYDRYLPLHGRPPVSAWEPHEIKAHDLILRYLTTAERRFKSEYNMLEHHWKTHHKPQKSASQPEPEPEARPIPELRFVNSETGESMDCHGNEYPPPPDWKPEPIIPGVYGPDHPANPLNWPKEKPRRR